MTTETNRRTEDDTTTSSRPRRTKVTHYANQGDNSVALMLGLGVRFRCGVYGKPIAAVELVPVVGGLMVDPHSLDCRRCVRATEAELAREARA